MLSLYLGVVLAIVWCSVAQPYQSFGSGRSQIHLSSTSEFVLLDYTVSPKAQYAAITFFWITGGTLANEKEAMSKVASGNGSPCAVDFALWRFYLDGETTASLGPVATSQAAFVGQNDPSAPWDNEYMGKNSLFGGWHVNILIPFSKSIKVTLQFPPGIPNTRDVYAMVRGVENIPLNIGGIPLPSTSRLHMVLKTTQNLAVLDFHELVNLPDAQGRLLGTMIDLTSLDNGTLNTLEGCWHAYFPGTQYASFPGLVLGTGSEDYPESAYYFNAGPYRGPTSGLTVMQKGDAKEPISKVSFYKLHHRDPIYFSTGIQFVWRNGDVTEPATGEKCTAITGRIIGKPGVVNVSTLVYLYTF